MGRTKEGLPLPLITLNDTKSGGGAKILEEKEYKGRYWAETMR